MASIKIDGIEVQLPPLSFRAVRKNREVIDALVGDAPDLYARAEVNIAFLRLSVPDADFEGASPAAIKVAAQALHTETFSRPEESAPAPQNP